MIELEELHNFHRLFKTCTPLFIALADEYRQKLILDIVDAGKDGINVSNLSAKSNLSRPAISHHLKVLKDCDLIRPKKIGTQIFYQLNITENFSILSELINSIQNVLKRIDETGNAARG